MDDRKSNGRAIRLLSLRSNPAAAFVEHHSRFSPTASDVVDGHSSGKFVGLVRPSAISTKFFEAPTAFFHSAFVLRITNGRKALWVADVYRPKLPAIRSLPLTFKQVEFLIEAAKVEVVGVECAGVWPYRFLQFIRKKFSAFQPTYFNFRQSNQREGSPPEFYSQIEKLFVPERTFVFLPAGELETTAEWLRDAAVAVLIVEKDRSLDRARPWLVIPQDEEADGRVEDVFSMMKEEEEDEGLFFSIEPEFDDRRGPSVRRHRAAFVLSESEMRILIVVKGGPTAGGLLQRALRTARRFHSLLRQLPTVQQSEVVFVAHVPQSTIDVIERFEVSEDLQLQRASGTIGQLRDDPTTSWFSDLCDDFAAYSCAAAQSWHRLWVVQTPDDSKEEAKEAKEEHNLWSSGSTVDPVAQLEAELEAKMAAEGIPKAVGQSEGRTSRMVVSKQVDLPNEHK